MGQVPIDRLLRRQDTMSLDAESLPHRGVVMRLIRRIRRLLYWCLPPVILYAIFSRVDFGRLRELFFNAEFSLIVMAIPLITVVIVTAALRWHFLLRHYRCSVQPVATSIGDYWKGLAVGVLIPGSLGSDAYRVMILGRQKGYYLRSVFIIVLEKLAALFACAVLIAGLYPLLTSNHLPNVVANIIHVLYMIFIAGAAFILTAIFIRHQGWGRRLAGMLNARLEAVARRMASLAPTSDRPAMEEASSRTALGLLLSAFSPAVVFPALGLSLSIMCFSAIQSQLYFQGLGYDVPFSVNLFVTPLLFLLFTLPISFGGLGIREGAFILLYGAFGVPAEIALVASFCSLLSTLLGYAIGAGLLLISKHRLGLGDMPVVASARKNIAPEQ
jgi:uncharacterized protein (TIRG00374 family)